MKRVLLASVAVLTLAGTAFAEGPDYSSHAAAVATDSNYLLNRDSTPSLLAPKGVSHFTTGAIPGEKGHRVTRTQDGVFGNYGPTVTPGDLHE